MKSAPVQPIGRGKAPAARTPPRAGNKWCSWLKITLLNPDGAIPVFRHAKCPTVSRTCGFESSPDQRVRMKKVEWLSIYGHRTRDKGPSNRRVWCILINQLTPWAGSPTAASESVVHNKKQFQSANHGLL